MPFSIEYRLKPVDVVRKVEVENTSVLGTSRGGFWDPDGSRLLVALGPNRSTINLLDNSASMFIGIYGVYCTA